MEEQAERIVLTKEEMLPYIKRSWTELQRFLGKKRRELGNNYNRRNNYELIASRFGNAREKPELYYDEYLLILEKKSKLPVSMREPIAAIVGKAQQALFSDKLDAIRKQKKEAGKKVSDSV